MAGKIRVEFIKSYRDNPKINAIVLMKVITNCNKYIAMLLKKMHPNNFFE